MRRLSVLLLFAILTLVGCGPTDYPPRIEFEHLLNWPDGSSSNSSTDALPGVDFGCVAVCFEQRPDTLPFAVLWLDDESHGSGGESEVTHEFSSALRKYKLDNETTVRIDCYKAYVKDEPMDFKIDGKQFDLKNGNFFLVSTRGGKIRVQQTKRDIGIKGMRFDRESIMATAKSDEGIRGFFTAAAILNTEK